MINHSNTASFCWLDVPKSPQCNYQTYTNIASIWPPSASPWSCYQVCVLLQQVPFGKRISCIRRGARTFKLWAKTMIRFQSDFQSFFLHIHTGNRSTHAPKKMFKRVDTSRSVCCLWITRKKWGSWDIFHAILCMVLLKNCYRFREIKFHNKAALN